MSSDAIQVITNVGFPIACVLGLGWYINTTMKEMIKILNEVNTSIRILNEKLPCAFKNDDNM